MPTYRYSGPHDATPHDVVADGYDRDDENFVTFFSVTAFDGDAKASPASLGVRVRGEVVTVEEQTP